MDKLPRIDNAVGVGGAVRENPEGLESSALLEVAHVGVAIAGVELTGLPAVDPQHKAAVRHVEPEPEILALAADVWERIQVEVDGRSLWDEVVRLVIGERQTTDRLGEKTRDARATFRRLGNKAQIAKLVELELNACVSSMRRLTDERLMADQS